MRTARTLTLGVSTIICASMGCATPPEPAVANGGAATGAAAPSAPLYETLPNGLRVVIQEHHAAPVAALRVYVLTGSLYEGEFLGAGISHYYEHLLSGGSTSTRPEAQNRKILDELGGNTNAYTTTDHTCYHITTTARGLPRAIDLYADWMKNCILAPAEVEREKGVIVSEINMGEDDPGRVLWKLYLETAFREHLMRLPVIGYRENFVRLTREDLVAFYRNRYVPNNAVVAISGDVDARETLAQVRAAFGDWERRPLVETPFPPEPPQTSMRRAEVEMAVPMAFLMMGFHTVDLFHPDLYALDVLDCVLGAGRSSRLVRTLQEERGLVFGVGTSSWTPHYGGGNFTISARLQPENLEATIEAALAVVERTRIEGITEEELARAKKQKAAEFVFGQQDAESIASRIASDVISAGDPSFSRGYVEGIQRVTAADVRRVLDTYFRRENLTCAIVRPPREGGASPTAGSASAAAGRAPVERHVLSNGLTVLTREDPACGVASVAVYWLGGNRDETPETNGVSRLTSLMLTRGTPTRTAQEIAAGMESLGGSLSPVSGSNTVGLTMSVLGGDFGAGMEILLDCLRNPSFPAGEMDRARREAVGALRNQKNDWGTLTHIALRETMFAGHPYALNPTGREEILQTATPEALAAFHRERLRADRMVVAVFGAVDADAVVRLLEDRLGDLPGGGAAPRWEPVALPARPSQPVVRPYGFQQVGLGWAYPGLRMADGDRYALDLIDAITSGVGLPGGWLHHALRGERDLVYTVHLAPWYGLDCGMVYVLTQCTPERRAEVTRIVEEQMARAARGEFTEEELRIAREICTTSHELERQTHAQVAGQAALDELYGLGFDAQDRYADGIRAVTMEQLRAVAARLLRDPARVVYEPEAPATPADE